MKQKKFYSTQLLLLAAIALFFSCGSKKQASHYSVQDEISEKLAEYKTAGWQIQGSSRTLRGVLSSVIDRLNENPDLVEVTGTANNFAVVSIGKEAAAANASNRYAATATRLVKGRSTAMPNCHKPWARKGTTSTRPTPVPSND